MSLDKSYKEYIGCYICKLEIFFHFLFFSFLCFAGIGKHNLNVTDFFDVRKWNIWHSVNARLQQKKEWTQYCYCVREISKPWYKRPEYAVYSFFFSFPSLFVHCYCDSILHGNTMRILTTTKIPVSCIAYPLDRGLSSNSHSRWLCLYFFLSYSLCFAQPFLWNFHHFCPKFTHHYSYSIGQNKVKYYFNSN